MPAQGERFLPLFKSGSVVVEEILSSDSPDPTPYRQDHDEWVVVLAGRAELEVDGRHVELTAGDHLTLPAGTPHTVVATEAGTHWLAVRVPARG